MEDPKTLTLLIPIVLGLAGHFGVFIDSKSKFRDRVNEVHGSLKENLTQYLAELLEYSHSIHDETLRQPLVLPALRGDDNNPDRVARYTDETWRTFSLLSKVSRASLWYKTGMYILFFATIIGIGLIICAFVFQEYLSKILFAGALVIGVQAISLVLLYVISDSFEKYERTH